MKPVMLRSAGAVIMIATATHRQTYKANGREAKFLKKNYGNILIKACRCIIMRPMALNIIHVLFTCLVSFKSNQSNYKFQREELK